MAPVRPMILTAGLQCLKLQIQIAVASPDPQTRAFPGTELSRNLQSSKSREFTKGGLVKGGLAIIIIVIIIIIMIIIIIVI